MNLLTANAQKLATTAVVTSYLNNGNEHNKIRNKMFVWICCSLFWFALVHLFGLVDTANTCSFGWFWRWNLYGLFVVDSTKNNIIKLLINFYQRMHIIYSLPVRWFVEISFCERLPTRKQQNWHVNWVLSPNVIQFFFRSLSRETVTHIRNVYYEGSIAFLHCPQIRHESHTRINRTKFAKQNDQYNKDGWVKNTLYIHAHCSFHAAFAIVPIDFNDARARIQLNR